MKEQFDNYEKRIMKKLDREAEDIERRIGEDQQVAESRADDELDRKVYAGVEAYENAIMGKNGSGTDAGNPAGLSPDDLEALRLGQELQRRLREEESRKKPGKEFRKHAEMWKRIVAAAAVFALVVGIGVNSIGGPIRIVEMMGLTIGEREISQRNSSTGEAKISDKERELEAYQKIRDE